MKILLILFLITACSKTITTLKVSDQPKNPDVFATANYLLIIENDDVPYESKEVTTIEVDGDLLSYTYGISSVYSKNKDGTPREGNHPNADFKMQSSVYRITKADNKIKLVFISSTCINEAVDPLASIVPIAPTTIEQSATDLKIEIQPGAVVSYIKDTEGTVNSLFELRSIALCQGESND
jgi:hypothetical protein